MRANHKVIDRDIELIMGRLLRAGVIISAIFVLFGGILYLYQNGNELPHYHRFRGEPYILRNVNQIFMGVFEFHNLSIIQLGLLVLIATPVARIVLSIFGFLFEKDYLFVIITIIVLIIIGYSLLGGIAI